MVVEVDHLSLPAVDVANAHLPDVVRDEVAISADLGRMMGRWLRVGGGADAIIAWVGARGTYGARPLIGHVVGALW